MSCALNFDCPKLAPIAVPLRDAESASERWVPEALRATALCLRTAVPQPTRRCAGADRRGARARRGGLHPVARYMNHAELSAAQAELRPLLEGRRGRVTEIEASRQLLVAGLKPQVLQALEPQVV